MKKIARMLSCAAIAACAAFAFSGNAMADLPADVKEFNARYAEEGKTPEGAVRLWLDAIFVYQNPATKAAGREMLRIIKHDLPADFEKLSLYGAMLERINTQQHIMRSYCAGSSPANNYKADVNNCELTVTKSKAGNADNQWRVALKSSGADSERWMTLIRNEDNEDLWQVYNASSMYMSIRPPKAK